MKIDVGVKEVLIKAVDRISIFLIDVAVPHGFPDHCSILCFHKSIVVAVP